MYPLVSVSSIAAGSLRARPTKVATPRSAAGQLGSSSPNFLFATLDSGTFADLRWPDCSDYSRSVSHFYESNNNTLRWFSARRDLAGKALISIWQCADIKGAFVNSSSDLPTPPFHPKLSHRARKRSVDRCEVLSGKLGTQLCIGTQSLLLRLGFVDFFSRYSHVGQD